MLLNKLKEKQRQLLLVFLVGILLVVIAVPAEERDVYDETEKSRTDTMNLAYEETLENKLEQVLMQIEGVGKAEVMLTFKASSEKIVEKDENSTVYEHPSDGGETPYVVREIHPKPQGILVIAEGGGNAVTEKNIRDAVQALFGLEAHKIRIMKMTRTN